MFWLIGLSVVILYFWSTINILKEYERGVIFKLGRLLPEAMGPGLEIDIIDLPIEMPGLDHAEASGMDTAPRRWLHIVQYDAEKAAINR